MCETESLYMRKCVSLCGKMCVRDKVCVRRVCVCEGKFVREKVCM